MNKAWLPEDSEIKKGLQMLSVVSYQSLGIGDLGSLGWILCLLRVGLKEIPFLGEEVFSVLSCLSGDKSPELDGFPMTFWQNR